MQIKTLPDTNTLVYYPNISNCFAPKETQGHSAKYMAAIFDFKKEITQVTWNINYITVNINLKLTLRLRISSCFKVFVN